MKITAVSGKECWRDEAGRWYSDGGFPLQMEAITSLFHQADLVIVEKPRRVGGLLLPAVNVIPLREPSGRDFTRKLAVVANLPYYFREIARSVKTADIVHVPLPGDIPLLAILLARFYGKPILARYGGSWHATNETTFMNRVTRTALRWLGRGPHVILATGNGATEPAKGMQWIFSSALSKREVESIHPELNRGLAKRPQLVYVGRLAPEKGLTILIKALHRLAGNPALPQPMVTLIGGGPDRESLERLVNDLGCQQWIRFTGQLDREQLSKQLLTADLCVQPSLTEGFSKAWVDAMAHGLPVLCSEVGAARSVIGNDGERGWLVPPGDEKALMERLQSVLTGDIEWAAMRQRCRSFAESRTLESWKERIGDLCALRWNWTLREGKLFR